MTRSALAGARGHGAAVVNYKGTPISRNSRQTLAESELVEAVEGALRLKNVEVPW